MLYTGWRCTGDVPLGAALAANLQQLQQGTQDCADSCLPATRCRQGVLQVMALLLSLFNESSNERRKVSLSLLLFLLLLLAAWGTIACHVAVAHMEPINGTVVNMSFLLKAKSI